MCCSSGNPVPAVQWTTRVITRHHMMYCGTQHNYNSNITISHHSAFRLCKYTLFHIREWGQIVPLAKISLTLSRDWFLTKHLLWKPSCRISGSQRHTLTLPQRAPEFKNSLTRLADTKTFGLLLTWFADNYSESGGSDRVFSAVICSRTTLRTALTDSPYYIFKSFSESTHS